MDDLILGLEEIRVISGSLGLRKTSTVGFSVSTLMRTVARYFFGKDNETVNAVKPASKNTSKTITLRVLITRQ